MTALGPACASARRVTATRLTAITTTTCPAAHQPRAALERIPAIIASLAVPAVRAHDSAGPPVD